MDGITRTLAAAFLLTATTIGLTAADPSSYLGDRGRHSILSSDMPPGAVGQARLAGRGPVAGYHQPVSIAGPEGTHFALAEGGSFLRPAEGLRAGLLVGGVYRFQITQIPGAAGAELYPTIEVIDRTYPPPGLAAKYPVVIQLDQEDLDAALDGSMVTRVIYLEDPQTATPQVQTPRTNLPLELPAHADALEMADRFGRPLAIVRIGSVSPPTAPALLPAFFFGYPTWVPIYQPEQPQPFDQTSEL